MAIAKLKSTDQVKCGLPCGETVSVGISMRTIMAVHITHPLHVAILVTDLEKAAHFYGEVLGLTPCDRPLKYPGIWYQIGDYQLHLLHDESTPFGLHNQDKWGRNRHVAFAIANLADAKDHLTAHGYQVQMSASGRPALFTHDPDGNVVELSEVTPD